MEPECHMRTMNAIMLLPLTCTLVNIDIFPAHPDTDLYTNLHVYSERKMSKDQQTVVFVSRKAEESVPEMLMFDKHQVHAK